jgi:spermidine synthase
MNSVEVSTVAKMKKTMTKHTGEITSVMQDRSGVGVLYGGLLFLSGVAALVYQVLWVRQLSLVVGIEVYSITVAVSAFFAGLAVGGAVFGRVADRVASAMRLYAGIETAVALCAMATTLLLPQMAMPFVRMQDHVGILAWALPFLLVGAPAFLMGGTLPVAVRGLRTSDAGAAQGGGLLYAANTAGGIVGALAASFALLPWFGVRGAALAAACLNVAAAGIAFVIAQRHGGVQSLKGQRDDAGAIASRLALGLYAVAGGIALGYEVVWSQAIAQFVSTRAFAFSIVLAVYLAGLAVGSWLGSRFALRVRDSWGLFGLLIVGAGLAAMLEFAVMGRWIVESQTAVESMALSMTGSEAMRMYAGFTMAGFGIVFVPTLLLGAAFPVALRLVVGTRHVGRDVGAVVAANTAGGILGTLLTGFVLIPHLGLVRTISLLAILALVIGLVSVFSSAGHRAMKLSIGAVGVAVLAAGVITPANRLADLLLATRGGGILVFYEESRGATVAIAQQHAKDNVFRRLFIQGVSNSGDPMPSMRYMRLQAMLPVLIHNGEPKSVLVIGFGTGITAGETLRYPGLEKRVCAELLPAVVRSGEMFPENYKAWSDPRMEIRIRDGRQELMRSDERYDVITLEPPPPSANGVANLYSTEFYELAKNRLAAKGLFAQWLPIATQNEGDTRSLVRSFLDAFPYATLWTTELHEMLLVGSEGPIMLDADTIARRFASGNVTTSLKAVGVDSPEALLATWVTGRQGLEKLAAGAKPVTDNRPRIEFGDWVRSNEITRALPQFLALKTEVPVEGADHARRAEIERRRSTLMDFYAAGLAAYEGDHQAWEQMVARVNSAEPGNTYYEWIIGRD